MYCHCKWQRHEKDSYLTDSELSDDGLGSAILLWRGDVQLFAAFIWQIQKWKIKDWGEHHLFWGKKSTYPAEISRIYLWEISMRAVQYINNVKKKKKVPIMYRSKCTSQYGWTHSPQIMNQFRLADMPPCFRFFLMTTTAANWSKLDPLSHVHFVFCLLPAILQALEWCHLLVRVWLFSKLSRVVFAPGCLLHFD